MLEQSSIEQLQQVVTLASTGRRVEAASLCRNVLSADPYNLIALLWLAHSASDQLEIENAIAQAYDLEPQNPSVLEAVNWYNSTFFPESASQTTSLQVVPPLEAPQPTSDDYPQGTDADDELRTPLGLPVPDHLSFWNSQNGMILTGAVIFLISNLAAFLNYVVIHAISWSPFGIRREVSGYFCLFLAIIAVVVMVVVTLDILTPPVAVYGYVSDHRKRRVDYKDGSNYYYDLLFLADQVYLGESNGNFVRLTLTEEQFLVSKKSNRAYVEYSKRFGSVKLYQPLQAKY